MEETKEMEGGEQKKHPLFSLSTTLLSTACVVMSLSIILLSLGVNALMKRTFQKTTLLFSEVMAGNSKTLFDETKKTPDWIELYNASNTDFNLNGYSLTDSLKDIKKYVFPDVILPAGGCLLLYASETYGSIGSVESIGFKLSKEGEALYLLDRNDNIIAQQAIPSLDSDISYALRSDGTYGYCASATPGKKNADATIVNDKPVVQSEKKEDDLSRYIASHASLFDPNSVYISEVCAVNSVNSELKDWIELYNGSEEIFDLTGCYLSDDKQDLKKWKIKSHAIEPKEYCVIEASPAAESDDIAPFGIQPDETIILSDSLGNILDVFDCGALRAGVTSGRIQGDSGVQRAYFTNPTKGKQNADQHFMTFAAKPAFSDTSLYHTGSLQLVITCATPNAGIYYTTDGTEPTTASTKYTGAVTISKNTAVRAIAVAENCLQSDSIAQTYLFDSPHTIPVVCLSGNAVDLKKVLNSDTKAYKPEYPIYTEFFEKDGSLGVSFPSGVRPKGKSSLCFAQNSLIVSLKGGYGQQDVTYPFFPGSSMQTFSNLTLRSSGQDLPDARIRDSFFHAVCNGIENLDSVQTRLVVVYINGVYFGLYDLGEEQNEEYLASHYNVDKDNIDLVNHKVTRIVGDLSEYKKVTQYARSWNLSDDEQFAEFAKYVDIDACTDFLVAQIYFGNGDVSNNRFWRATDYSVKWRPLYFDLDYCLRYNDESRNVFSKYLVDNPSIGGSDGAGNTLKTEMYIFSGLMENKAWRQKFVERFVQLAMTQYNTDRILAIFDEMVATMKPEMQAHINKWHVPTMSRWQSEIAKLRDALEKRQTIVLKQLQNYFHVPDATMQGYIDKYKPAAGN